ncbi:MAG: DNA repair protein RadA [Clostridia bacterium]|nr:DNA repair protein RadA [Clostridia bacterium]
MKKLKTVFICSECGYESAKWNGICPSCGQGNTMLEEVKEISSAKSKSPEIKFTSDNISQIKINNIDISSEVRYKTGFNELDRVFGGGIVKGSITLLGGTPGIGKSTLLLQICNYLNKNLKILYVSGEESKRQIKMRASRLNINNENLFIMTETNINLISEEIKFTKPDMVIIDSVQTMNNTESSSFPGSVSQVKECTNIFLKLSKMLDITIIMIGHVNKDGAIAGPKVLEHMVDAVLYFEGDNQNSYRILRAVKNRHGSTNEIGVFEMNNEGLREVENPSAMMLSGKPNGVPGICVVCTMEGSRPILTEVQGLVTSTNFGNPRRMATGFDYNRLALILAVLEKRAGYFFSSTDVYVNIVGGLKLEEPAADLSVAIALVSSLKDTSVNDEIISFGEVGLAGEIRAVPNAELRIKEAQKLGFKKCIIPYHNFKSLQNTKNYKIEIIGVKNIREAVNSALI